MNKSFVHNSRVIVYPAFNAFRYSFYIHALRNLFPEKDIIYSSDEFPNFKSHSLPLIVRNDFDLKIYIAAGDGPGYAAEALEWCDLYAKRTLLTEQIPQQYAKKIV